MLFSHITMRKFSTVLPKTNFIVSIYMVTQILRFHYGELVFVAQGDNHLYMKGYFYYMFSNENYAIRVHTTRHLLKLRCLFETPYFI